jgi:protein O-GlcNAc transferase
VRERRSVEHMSQRPTEPHPGELRALVEHFEASRYEEAAVIGRSLTLRFPNHPFGWKALGAVLKQAGRAADALAPMRRAVALSPADPEGHLNLGKLLLALGHAEEAVHSLCASVTLLRKLSSADSNATALADALKCVGNALVMLGRLEEAEASYRGALDAKPNDPDACTNLGNVAKDLGRLEEAEACYRLALAMNPASATVHSNVIFVLDMRSSSTIAEQQAERERWYDAHGRRLAAWMPRHDNVPDPARRLRVGYVSADFCMRSPYFTFGPVVALHDPSSFEVTCYSDVVRPDMATARLRQAAQRWRDTAGMTDEALADQVREDGIDILVDLTSHMSGSRLLAFCRKPAPLQVTAWGYANGTGLRTMDYLLADSVVVKPEERRHFAEEVLDLPCFLCYEAPAHVPPVSPLPALAGRPLTFGCFNRVEKISDAALELWARILAELPQSRLLIKGRPLHSAGARARLCARLQAREIDLDRVSLLGDSSHYEHLRSHHNVDVMLDPLPHGGGMSTAEALWMGVPVVTLYGDAIPGRASASFLSVLAMEEWIGSTKEDYVRIAVEAARDLGRLTCLRQAIRPRMAQSVIGDVGRYAQIVESAYRTMWQRWCRRAPQNS